MSRGGSNRKTILLWVSVVGGVITKGRTVNLSDPAIRLPLYQEAC